jgi:hypothetical protein
MGKIILSLQFLRSPVWWLYVQSVWWLYIQSVCIWRAQVKVGLINLCKGLFSLNAGIYYKLKSGA